MGSLSFCSFKQYLKESIDPSEAVSPLDSIQTVIDKKRDVGYHMLTDKELEILRLNNVKYIKVPRKDKLDYYIFYNDEAKALRLLEISQRHDGMLKSENYEEAIEIGKLLGYNLSAIDKHVFDKFGRRFAYTKIAIDPLIDVDNLHDE